MSTLLQKKKLSQNNKNSDSSIFDVELQPLVSPNSKPFSVPSVNPTTNPFSHFPSTSQMSSQPIQYYPVASSAPVLQQNPFIPQVQIPTQQNPYLPQVQHHLQPQLSPQQYYLPQNQMLPQYIPQVLPGYPATYPNQLASQPANFSSSVLSQPNVGQFTPLYPVIEQQPQTMHYPAIDQIFNNSNKEPKEQVGSKEPQTKDPQTREKTKSIKESSKERPKDLSLDQVITKRCKRCCAYYVEKELEQAENKNPCKYHPGSFKTGYSSTLIAGARLQYWTCCKSSNKNDQGCKTGKHIEDPQMTTIQTRSAQQPPQAQIGVLIDFVPATTEQPNDKQKEREVPEKKKNLIRHYVTDADTLIGIAFRYHVTPQSIRQLNRMATDDVQGYSKLYVPRKGHQATLSELDSESEDESGPPQNLSSAERVLFEKRMLAKLRAQTGISNEEANYYLNLYGWAYNNALKEYQEDIEWEKNNKRVPSRKCK